MSEEPKVEELEPCPFCGLTSTVVAVRSAPKNWLATFYRKHTRLEVVMDKDDELRAIGVVMKTLNALKDWRARQRVLDYCHDRLRESELDQVGATPAVPPAGK